MRSFSLDLSAGWVYCAEMNDPTAALTIEVAVYSVLFVIGLGQHLHWLAMCKLRDEHRAETETLRGTTDAEKDALRGLPRILTHSLDRPYAVAYNEVVLAKTIEMIQ